MLIDDHSVYLLINELVTTYSWKRNKAKHNTELEGEAQHDIQKAGSKLVEVNPSFSCLLGDITTVTNACTSWHLKSVTLTNESLPASEMWMRCAILTPEIKQMETPRLWILQ